MAAFSATLGTFNECCFEQDAGQDAEYDALDGRASQGESGKVRTLNRLMRGIGVCLLLAATEMAVAQSSVAAQTELAANPAASVREHRNWELGPFVNAGNGLIDRTDFHFLSLGFQLGKAL